MKVINILKTAKDIKNRFKAITEVKNSSGFTTYG